MIYYADYEALEFNSREALSRGVLPYYLNSVASPSALCPIYFSACDEEGTLVNSQNVLDCQISFLRFVDQITEEIENEKEQITICFHNIKYDFRIIVHELFFNDFTNIVDSNKLKYEGEFSTKKDNAFAIVGESLSKFIGINLYYQGFKIKIRDTMSILNTSQDKILKDFGFELKKQIDWNKITVHNLNIHIEDIKNRNIYDVTSLAKAIEAFKNVFYSSFQGSGDTAASMAMDAFKSYLCDTTNKKNSTKNKKEIFNKRYPIVQDTAKEIAAGCYNGGICAINPKYRGKTIKDIQMLDVNSSYPFSMTKPLPLGTPKEISSFTTGDYAEYIVDIAFRHKGIPFQRCHSENKALAILGKKLNSKPYTRAEMPYEFEGFLCLNSIDLQTLQKYAKISSLKFIKGYGYQTDEVMKNFIEKVYEQKKTAKGVKKAAVKLLLNSLYGKYAQDLSGVVSIYENTDKSHKIIAIDENTIFKPLASAVTAYSRQIWVDMVYLLGDDFIYGDTDSTFFLNPIKNIENARKKELIHRDNLGKWSLDDEYQQGINKGKFLSKKNYLLEANNELHLKCVGLAHRYHYKIDFDNFVINSIPFEIQKMVNIYGGKAMRLTEFHIRERNFY